MIPPTKKRLNLTDIPTFVKKEGFILIWDIKKELGRLYQKRFGVTPQDIVELPQSGSGRSYYRITGSRLNTIGTHNPNSKENRTFIAMTRFFLQENIPVPEIYETDLSKNLYLQQDLGDQTLFSILTQDMDSPKSYSTRKQYLQTAVKELARIQIVAGKKLDFNVCYPYKTFSQSAILYDLNYFRKQFLDRIHLPYNKGKLRKDFRKLSEFIDTADKEYFMFRDFQSRNIMVSNEKLYFIDYQGGRKGPLQYDLASLLFQARARIPEKLRTEILEYYVRIARMLTPLSREEFLAYYYAIALIRVLQTLGAYGLRGLKEKKAHFIQSIPFALENLHPLSKKNKLLEDLPELRNTIEKLKNINISEYGSIS